MAKLSKNYAKSLLEMNITNTQANEVKAKVNKSSKDLFLLSTAILLSPNFYSFFKNPLESEAVKYQILTELIPNLKGETLSLLKLLVEKGELKLLPEISKEYEKLTEKTKGIKIIKLIIASKLDQSLGPIFLKKLKSITNEKNIILEIQYQKDILGGVILEYGSLALDSSILTEFKTFFN
jgi:F-type H+-transporting ATPase subunit delta